MKKIVKLIFTLQFKTLQTWRTRMFPLQKTDQESLKQGLLSSRTARRTGWASSLPLSDTKSGSASSILCLVVSILWNISKSSFNIKFCAGVSSSGIIFITFHHDHFPHFCEFMLTGSSGCRPWVSWMTIIGSIYICFLLALSLLLANYYYYFFFFGKISPGFITGRKGDHKLHTLLSMWWNEQQLRTDQLLTCFKEWSLITAQFSSFQSLSCVRLFATPWTAACQASLSITNSWSLLKLMSIESVMPSNHLILRHPLLLPSIFSSIRVFSNESALLIRWPKYWSFSFSISPSNEYSGLISFRMDWLDLLAIQGTLKSLLQHHSSKASILQCSAFFIVQLSTLLEKSQLWLDRPFLTVYMLLLLLLQSRFSRIRLCATP